MGREKNRKFGARSESIAVTYLERASFRIVERNFYAGKIGEIDIIAQKDGVLHFVEVKSSRRDFDPIYNITPAKLKRVIDSAYIYMKRKGIDSAFSIDALIIRGEEVELIENITM
jgi:putative endonuclease